MGTPGKINAIDEILR